MAHRDRNRAAVPEVLLKLLLLSCGVACLVGLPGLYMPRSWMAVAHEWLGMGPFPEGPIAEYLARLTSGLYALYGGLVVMMARDVRRNAPLITFQAIGILVLGLSGSTFGWPIGVPKWWLMIDSTSVVAFCGGTLFLQAWLAAESGGSRS